MNLNEFKSALPKPWLRVNSGVGICGIPLYDGTYVLAQGAGVITLSAKQMVSGVLIVDSGRSAGISLPLTAEIDAYTGTPVDGTRVILKVINREPTNAIALSSIEIPGQPIPKSQAGGASTTTDFHFLRVAGSYICLNA